MACPRVRPECSPNRRGRRGRVLDPNPADRETGRSGSWERNPEKSHGALKRKIDGGGRAVRGDAPQRLEPFFQVRAPLHRVDHTRRARPTEAPQVGFSGERPRVAVNQVGGFKHGAGRTGLEQLRTGAIQRFLQIEGSRFAARQFPSESVAGDDDPIGVGFVDCLAGWSGIEFEPCPLRRPRVGREGACGEDGGGGFIVGDPFLDNVPLNGPPARGCIWCGRWDFRSTTSNSNGPGSTTGRTSTCGCGTPGRPGG